MPNTNAQFGIRKGATSKFSDEPRSPLIGNIAGFLERWPLRVFATGIGRRCGVIAPVPLASIRMCRCGSRPRSYARSSQWCRTGRSVPSQVRIRSHDFGGDGTGRCQEAKHQCDEQQCGDIADEVPSFVAVEYHLGSHDPGVHNA